MGVLTSRQCPQSQQILKILNKIWCITKKPYIFVCVSVNVSVSVFCSNFITLLKMIQEISCF